MSKREKYIKYIMEFIMLFIAFMIGAYLELPKLLSLIISALIFYLEIAFFKIIKRIIFKKNNKNDEKK
ncbi:hypothetical protein [Clostridium sp. KNHs205]|uniref:hypothetical protein n=1 Tax=Clostridium sp. KNHs205 TaxID=1449050 RepID=UPI00051AED11|nr:hypothetical protein [Clostridium sp. KNHs205]